MDEWGGLVLRNVLINLNSLSFFSLEGMCMCICEYLVFCYFDILVDILNGFKDVKVRILVLV